MPKFERGHGRSKKPKPVPLNRKGYLATEWDLGEVITQLPRPVMTPPLGVVGALVEDGTRDKAKAYHCERSG